MKNLPTIIRTTLVASLMAALMPAVPLQAVTFESADAGQGNVVIEGTSTLHDWDVKGEDIRGTLTVGGDATNLDAVEALFGADLRAEVVVPVDSLTSESRGMDRRMFNALETSDYPNVVFNLESLSEIPAEQAAALAETAAEGAVFALAAGELTISGTTRAIEFPASLHWDGATLTVEIDAELTMSDYGVDPPRALMGTIRTGDDVAIRAVWTPNLVE